MTGHDTLVAWLNDAHALEQQLIQVLEKQTNHAEDYPEIRQRLSGHQEETRRHAELVEQCIEQLDGKVSASKSAMGKVMGFFEGVASAPADDTLVKDCLADFSMEQMEIASYKGLISAAESLGEQEVADTCRQILRDEEEMARWLDEHLPEVIQDHLSRQKAA